MGKVTVSPLAQYSIGGSASVCSGTSAIYAASGTIPGSNYQWKVNNINAGANIASFSYTPVNGDLISCVMTPPALSCVSTATATSNTLTVTVAPSVTPTATIATPATAVCGSNNVSFTATTNVSGSSYQWQVNSVNAGTSSSNLTYTPANGDVVNCVVTMPAGGCYPAPSVTSNAITMSVGTPVVPAVTITPAATAVCAGAPVAFTAASNVSGVSYQWKVGGINTGTGGASFTYTPANGDVVSCETTMPATGCFTTASAVSAGITMAVTTPVIPTATATSSAATVCAGRSVSLSATTNISGATYQWQVNALNAGTGATFSYVPANGDIVRCEVGAPAGACYTSGSIRSNAISLSVTPMATPAISLAAPASVPAGGTVVLTATVSNAGSGYRITWTRNGQLLSQTSVPTTSYIKSAGIDTVTAAVVSTDSCFTSTGSGAVYIGDALGVPTAPAIGISVYPLPFSDQLFVRGAHPGDRFVLTSASGQVVARWEPVASTPVQRLQVREIASGIYFLKVITQAGGVRGAIRLVRE